MLAEERAAGIDKVAVARRFDRSALTYDAHSRVQRAMARRLVAGLDRPPRRILELGCGTGGLTARLARRFPGAEIVAVDIAPGMLERARAGTARPGVEFRLADAEELPPDGAFDLVLSNAAIQWFAAPGASLARLARTLEPGGQMRHATFGPATFRELRLVTASEPAGGGLVLRPEAEWRRLLASAGLAAVAGRTRRLSVAYPDAWALLEELRATGVTYRPGLPGAPGRLRAREIARLYDARFGGPGGVRATYELVEVAAVRPPI